MNYKTNALTANKSPFFTPNLLYHLISIHRASCSLICICYQSEMYTEEGQHAQKHERHALHRYRQSITNPSFHVSVVLAPRFLLTRNDVVKASDRTYTHVPINATNVLALLRPGDDLPLKTRPLLLRPYTICGQTSRPRRPPQITRHHVNSRPSRRRAQAQFHRTRKLPHHQPPIHCISSGLRFHFSLSWSTHLACCSRLTRCPTGHRFAR